MKTYLIKSTKRRFPKFTVKDEHLGYLDLNIEEEAWDLFKINVRVDIDKDVLIRPLKEDKNKWYKIVYIPNSTEYYLEHKEILKVS